MLPRAVCCEECGEKAVVRGYGRVEYDWTEVLDIDATLRIKAIRLTIDCPRCGVCVQDYHPLDQVA